MRSELNEAALIDEWLFGRMGDEDGRHFEARLLTDEAFAEKVEVQRMAHRLVRRYARTEEKGRLERIYRLLLHEPDFANQLNAIFT